MSTSTVIHPSYTYGGTPTLISKLDGWPVRVRLEYRDGTPDTTTGDVDVTIFLDEVADEDVAKLATSAAQLSEDLFTYLHEKGWEPDEDSEH